MSTSLLRIENLTKYFRSYWLYRRLPAVNDLSLEIHDGEAFGFLGHNGAGKTTTMKCIVGLLEPNSGQIFFQGKSLSDHRLRSNIGYLPELPYFYDHLSVWETLELFARLYGRATKSGTPIGKERINEVLQLLSLAERKHQRVRELSKGLQQRLAMASTLLNRPKLLLLDEPFSGLDPLGRKEFREILFSLKAEGATVFLSTHVLSDIEDICDRVSIMAKGELKTTFSLTELPKLYGSNFELQILLPVEHADSARESFRSFAPHMVLRDAPQGKLAIATFADYESATVALHQAQNKNFRVEAFHRIMPRLEDVFVEVTSKANTQGQSTHG